MKPHITHWEGRWFCNGYSGHTVEEAYYHWAKYTYLDDVQEKLGTDNKVCKTWEIEES